jgi:GNAT superfamily N-acetyltransferase
MSGAVTLEPVTEPGWLAAFIAERWGAPGVVSRGRVWSGESGEGLSAIRAMDEDGLAGVVSWHPGPEEWEIVTVNARDARQGVGTHMLDAVVEMARRAGTKRLWLVTSNDNLDALRFYQRRGWRLAALRPGAIAEARRLKPSIPEQGAYGIPLTDEIELEYTL